MSTEQVEVLGKYQPYPEYKDSGVEWLGEVPQHWQTGRLGSFGYFISGCGFPMNTKAARWALSIL